MTPLARATFHSLSFFLSSSSSFQDLASTKGTNNGRIRAATCEEAMMHAEAIVPLAGCVRAHTGDRADISGLPWFSITLHHVLLSAPRPSSSSPSVNRLFLSLAATDCPHFEESGSVTDVLPERAPPWFPTGTPRRMRVNSHLSCRLDSACSPTATALPLSGSGCDSRPLAKAKRVLARASFG